MNSHFSLFILVFFALLTFMLTIASDYETVDICVRLHACMMHVCESAKVHTHTHAEKNTHTHINK